MEREMKMDVRETKKILLEWAESPTPCFRQSSPICKGYGHGIYKVKSAVKEKLSPKGGGLTALRGELKQLYVFSRSSATFLGDHGLREGISDSIVAMRRRAEDFVLSAIDLKKQKKAAAPKAKKPDNGHACGRKRAVLTRQEVKKMSEMLADGVSLTDISEKLGYNRKLLKVYAIELGYALKGRRWVRIETIKG